jgi:hypothetical protein
MTNGHKTNWVSNKILDEESVRVLKGQKVSITEQGILVEDTNGAVVPSWNDRDGWVYPCNEGVTWEEDFYEKVWENDL